MLFEHSYASQFGTFLGNNESERWVDFSHGGCFILSCFDYFLKETTIWFYINVIYKMMGITVSIHEVFSYFEPITC